MIENIRKHFIKIVAAVGIAVASYLGNCGYQVYHKSELAKQAIHTWENALIKGDDLKTTDLQMK
jgi:hypothetical protein